MWVCGLFGLWSIKKKFSKERYGVWKSKVWNLNVLWSLLSLEESAWNDVSWLVLTWPFLSAFQNITSEIRSKTVEVEVKSSFEPECITTAIQQSLLTSLFTSLSSRHRTFINAQKVFFRFKWLKRSVDELQLCVIFLPTLLAQCLCSHGYAFIVLCVAQSSYPLNCDVFTMLAWDPSFSTKDGPKHHNYHHLFLPKLLILLKCSACVGKAFILITLQWLHARR